MSVAEQLQAMGIELPPTPSALAIYRPAVRTGNLVMVSGHLPMQDGALLYTGHVGGNLTVDQGREAARLAALNALASIQALLGTLEGLRLIRTVGYVACPPDFTDHGAVVNGASELLRDLFGEERGLGARTSIGMASLPLGAPVEIELMLEVE